MTRLPSNKLTIYLIKNKYEEFADVLKNEDSLVPVSLEDTGIFYYAKSQRHQPNWIKKFFQGSLRNVNELYSASANALFLTRIDCGKSIYKTFAVAFGQGRSFLRNNVYEERFGLKVVLNIVDPESIRKIDKKSMTSIPKDTSEQLTKAGVVADFGVDIEQDLVRAIMGKSLDERFGKTVMGRDALTVTAPQTLTSLSRFLSICYEESISNKYKKNFDWIDQFSEIKDEDLIADLDNDLIQNVISGNHEKTWMAVPEIVEWENIQGFGYSENAEDLKEDISLSDFLSSLGSKEISTLNINSLTEKTVYSFDNNDNIQKNWSSYECMYSEMSKNGKTYLLSNSKWYEIDKKFTDLVSADFQRSIESTGLSLPTYHHENESDYNIKVPIEQAGYFCMDKNLINHGGAHGKVEFCDLITEDKKIIHVKRYGGSSVLSHLFSQGLVSGELFLSDREFREKVNSKLPEELKLKDIAIKPIPADYKIIFAIISEVEGDLEIPFFSKVNFRNTKRRLETFGYPVTLIKIEVNK